MDWDKSEISCHKTIFNVYVRQGNVKLEQQNPRIKRIKETEGAADELCIYY